MSGKTLRMAGYRPQTSPCKVIKHNARGLLTLLLSHCDAVVCVSNACTFLFFKGQSIRFGPSKPQQ